MLRDLECKTAKPRKAAYRISDSGSLFLIVRRSGVKSWEFRWKRGGKVKGIVVGKYPDVGVKAARGERDRYKAMLAAGFDPLAQKALAAEEERQRLAEVRAKREAERAARLREKTTFEKVALEWIDRHKSTWTEQHAEQVEQSLRDYVFAHLGVLPIDAIGTKDVLDVLDKMLGQGKLETAARVKQRMSSIFEFAALEYHVNADPVSLVRKEFTRRLTLARRTRPVENFATVKPSEAPALLRALRSYTGPAGRLVWLIALTACRTGEARAATWEEFDLDNAIWTVPPARMKARREHTIPLSRQAIRLLKVLEAERGKSELLFPNSTKPDRPASENAVLSVLAAIDYKGRMTGHGFRSLFSTIANESGRWRSDAIEAALAHTEKDDTRAAYNHTNYLHERRRLMQWWAEELDRLESGKSARAPARRRATTK